jgi:hypothetical protein
MDDLGSMKNSNKTTVLTMVVSLLVAFVLVMSGPEGSMMINSNYVYAKSSGGGGGGSSGGGGSGGGSSNGGGSSSHSSKGGGDGGGGGSDNKGGGDGGGGSSSSSGGSSSDKGSSSSSSDKSGGSISFGKGKGSNGDNLNDDDHGPPSAPGNDLPGNNMGSTPNPSDDGFTNKDGPQPKVPRFPGDDGSGRSFCEITHRCIPKIHFPPSPDNCRRHHNCDDHIKVIHKTVVVHDKDNNPQTILLNTNTQTGTCFVSSQEVVNVPDLVTQLLNQCTSVTITP